MIITIAWLLCSVYSIRFIAGYIAHDFSLRPDGAEWAFGIFAGCIIGGPFGPLVALSRVVYVLHQKYMPEGSDGALEFLFPEPKAVQTRGEKKRAEALAAREADRAEREELSRKRREINATERELGLPESSWS